MRNQRNLPSAGTLVLFVLYAGTADAALAQKRPEVLRSDSTHIVVGTVKSIMNGNDEVSERKLATSTGVVEVRVTAIEKGDQIKAGDVIYARFWRTRWVGEGNPPPHSRGHLLPAKDESVRVYLHLRDGGYDALSPNGFEIMKPKSVKPQL